MQGSGVLELSLEPQALRVQGLGSLEFFLFNGFGVIVFMSPSFLECLPGIPQEHPVPIPTTRLTNVLAFTS